MQDCFEAVPFLQREECVGFRAGGLGDGDVVNKYLKKKKKKGLSSCSLKGLSAW